LESALKFPFVTRARHEEVVSALAKLLYPNGVPREFQMLLGIHIDEEQAQTQVAAEPELTDDEKAIEEMKAEQARDQAEIALIRRVRPSQLGPALARMMEKYGHQSAYTAVKQSPASAIFAKAEEEAIKASKTN
jgi:creatinine amidohydrolase/Fe(II)-dependent formamide hydrolase-like protein